MQIKQARPSPYFCKDLRVIDEYSTVCFHKVQYMKRGQSIESDSIMWPLFFFCLENVFSTFFSTSTEQCTLYKGTVCNSIRTPFVSMLQNPSDIAACEDQIRLQPVRFRIIECEDSVKQSSNRSLHIYIMPEEAVTERKCCT